MARKKVLEEARKIPIVSYTTESHAERVREFVDREGKGATLSTWVLQLINQVVPIQAPVEEPVFSNA